MTLRARLTSAFLVIVIGPVLIGAAFVAMTVNSVNKSRERDRLDVAVTSLHTAIDATCARLAATAETAADVTVAGTKPALAQALVTQGRASAIHIESAAGADLATTAAAPPPPWALCAPLPSATAVPFEDHDFRAVAAVVQMRDPAGTVIGYVYAAQTLDALYLRQLASASGVDVTVVADPTMTTTAPAAAPHIAHTASKLDATGVGKARSQYIRRVEPLAGQPLDFAVSVPIRTTNSLLATVIAVVLFAALAAIGAAWALARSTTKPLDEITEAADRVAHGDLGTRVPVRHDDEVGQLGAAFNRMTREMQSYVDALTASRDQLRGNLDVLGNTLSSTHDLPRILRVILASAVRATGAGAGAVLLTDPVDGGLVCQCAEGFDEHTTAVLETLRLPVGAGLLGAVAATGTPRRGRTDGDLVLAGGEPVVRTYLAVPLRLPMIIPGRPEPDDEWAFTDLTAGATAKVDMTEAPTAELITVDSGTAGIRGVIALYDRLGDDDFDDTDLRTVRTFAGHAAVAVDNVRLHEEAQRLSHTDPLTGLYNYRHLKELLRREVNRSSRFGHSLCVIVLDLDRFKEVNDAYGHAAGDAVLVEFARRIGVEIRGVDLAFRYGGEEFVLLLPETDGLGGITLARRLGAAVRESVMAVSGSLRHVTAGIEPVRSAHGPEPRPSGSVEPRFGGNSDQGPGNSPKVDTRPPGSYGALAAGVDRPESTIDISVTVSIGVAVFPDHGDTGAAVLEAADDALYAAKAAGRDTFRLADGRVGGAADRAPEAPSAESGTGSPTDLPPPVTLGSQREPDRSQREPAGSQREPDRSQWEPPGDLDGGDARPVPVPDGGSIEPAAAPVGPGRGAGGGQARPVRRGTARAPGGGPAAGPGGASGGTPPPRQSRGR